MAFRKSTKLFGIFRLTTTGKGVSLSAGVPGARVSINNKGDVRRTVSVPGSGWYDTKKIGNIHDRDNDSKTFPMGENTLTVDDDGFTVTDPAGDSSGFRKEQFDSIGREGNRVDVFIRIEGGLAQIQFPCSTAAEADELEAALA